MKIKQQSYSTTTTTTTATVTATKVMNSELHMHCNAPPNGTAYYKARKIHFSSLKWWKIR